MPFTSQLVPSKTRLLFEVDPDSVDKTLYLHGFNEEDRSQFFEHDDFMGYFIEHDCGLTKVGITVFVFITKENLNSANFKEFIGSIALLVN